MRRPSREERKSIKVARKILNHYHLLWPVPGGSKVTSHFGRRWGKDHQGIDIAAREGSHILAADDGVAAFSGKMGGYGRVMVISHLNGLFTVYAHNKVNYIKKGERVSRGQVIGQVGRSGKATGPHLHFEIRKNGHAINPSYALFKE
ncbi:MAG: M23 family metallopeptidase [Halobacteriovoraceae bacterium]|nr:M23 family metallopeptidase [Halobacteriovoraceae bacterium]